MISTAPEIDHLIDAGAPLLICVSGGKDSRLVADESIAYARSRNHTGPQLLIYSDLGRVVWADAQDQCRRLADRLGVDLQIVKRAAGGLMERWSKRWDNNVERYVNLSCVKLILPFSTPQLRFCTSEMKTKLIQSWIRKTYEEPVICVLGIRRDEGNSTKSGRGAAPVFTVHQRKTDGSSPALPAGSIDWNAIVEVKTEVVFQIMRASSEPEPSAYGFGSQRFSCAYCIMSSLPDLLAATRDPRNHDIYREQCELEIVSTFSFQSKHWLSDVAPDLLTADQRARLVLAKEKATARQELEAKIPRHLLYEKGWPNVMPTLDEAVLIADVRRQMGIIMGLDVKYTTAKDVLQRYADLMQLKQEKLAAAKAKALKSAGAAAKRRKSISMATAASDVPAVEPSLLLPETLSSSLLPLFSTEPISV